MYSVIESEDWMMAGEVRCGCIGVVVNMHAIVPEIHECSQCGATWLSGDGRVAGQWRDGVMKVAGEAHKDAITVTVTDDAEWAVAK